MFQCELCSRMNSGRKATARRPVRLRVCNPMCRPTCLRGGDFSRTAPWAWPSVCLPFLCFRCSDAPLLCGGLFMFSLTAERRV